MKRTHRFGTMERDATGRRIIGKLPDGRKFTVGGFAVAPVTRWNVVEGPLGFRLTPAEAA